MKLLIKNKIFSLGEGSKVFYEDGKTKAFEVKGKVFSITRKKFIQDLEGNTLYMVRNKYWTFLVKKAFICDAEGKILATVSRKISIKSKFSVEGEGCKMDISGDFLGFNYDILKDGQKIAHVHRKLWALNDAFEADIEDDKDAALVTALVIAIDNISDHEQSDSNN